MRFLNPQWLWLLFLLPAAYGIFVLYEARRRNQFAQFADPKQWPLIVPEMDFSHRFRKTQYFLIALGFLLIALARPQFGSHEETVRATGLDIMLALDVSTSMEVEDVVPSRLKKAKHLIRSLMQRLDGDRVGVVAFAASSYVVSPLTTDLSYLWETIQILGPSTIQNQGTDLAAGLETALQALERGAEEGFNQQETAPSHVIILISDGEDHENQISAAVPKIKKSGTKLYVLGIGSEKGGPIPIWDPQGNAVGYKRDRAGQPVISTFHPETLRQAASAAGGKYWTITTSEDEIEDLIQDLSSLHRADYAERRYLVYEDRFQIPLMIAILIFLLEISVPTRKSIASLFVFLGVGLTGMSKPLWAKAPTLDAYLENQKGIKAYKGGKMEEAEKNFGAAQAQDPSRPELQFNQGVVQFQKGDVDQAIEAFKSSAQSAMTHQNPSLTGKSLFNLGNAFAKKGDLKSAVKSYLGAIQAAKESQDPELESGARKNLQLLLNETKKQEQKKQEEDKKQKDEQKNQGKDGEQDQKSQSGNEEKSGSTDQSKNSEEKNQQGDKKNQEKSEPYRDPKKGSSKNSFRSKKMSQEDADRVMSELGNRERELQEKLQSQNVKFQSHDKDW